jgi:predicted DNA-binding protein
MPLSVRLDPELEARIDAHSKETGLSKSKIITRGVQEYLEVSTGTTLYQLAIDVLKKSNAAGKESGLTKHSETRRKDYRAHIKKKHAGRTGTRG